MEDKLEEIFSLQEGKNNLTIEEDIDRGIYLPHATKLTLNGQIPIEVKCTAEFPKDEPPEWLGVLQLMSSMEILDAEYGVLIVLWQGTDLRIIQKLLGHSDIRTTQIYLKVSNASIKNVRSPLDNIKC